SSPSPTASTPRCPLLPSSPPATPQPLHSFPTRRSSDLTIVPLELYFKDGLAKVAIALAKAKQQHDKREELKRRVAERELARGVRSEEHTSELQSRFDLVCRLLLEKKKREMVGTSVRSAE